MMMLRGGLVLCLLLWRLANAEKLQRHIRRHGKQAQGLDMYFSRGVHLIVKGAKPLAPKITMLVPPTASYDSGPSAILCVVTGLYTGVIDITWSINHVPVHRRHTAVQAVHLKDGSYTVNGLLFLEDRRDWSPQHTYRCTVTLDGRVFQAHARPDSCWT
ncbi:uncharacterized protein si:ch211-1a19.2 [Engraulis encrasicolus]|uniref:uncharacterized protein si:ch211-1a19.2 n=1 Tax=Engraulis encrasicolus TaxID=184585 RepID=UPI002FCF17E9